MSCNFIILVTNFLHIIRSFFLVFLITFVADYRKTINLFYSVFGSILVFARQKMCLTQRRATPSMN